MVVTGGGGYMQWFVFLPPPPHLLIVCSIGVKRETRVDYVVKRWWVRYGILVSSVPLQLH